MPILITDAKTDNGKTQEMGGWSMFQKGFSKRTSLGVWETSCQQRFLTLSLAVARVFLFLALLLVVQSAKSEQNDQCLKCHADDGIKPVTERGKKLALKVTNESLKGSVHEDIPCSECHSGADDFEKVPHREDAKPMQVTCGSCHEKEESDYFERCVHGRARKAGNPNAPSCQDCHGSHFIPPLKSEKSPMAPMNQPETCGRCHSRDDLEEKAHISKRRLIERYKSSVHWLAVKEGKPAATCSDCHGSHSIMPSNEPDSLVSRLGLLNACRKCHLTVVEAFESGSHGRALLQGNSDVPNCITCHGDHDIISLRVGPTGTRTYAATQVCMWCHGNERMMRRYALDTVPVESYLRDYHGLTQRGSQGASATCADCHDAHRSLPSSHPQSRMHISNRATTCGRCHGKASESFILSFSHRTSTPSGGEDIKTIVLWVYVVLMVVIVGGMFLHNLLIWLHALRQKIAYQRRRAIIVRMNAFERIWHILLLVSFFMLAFTGFALKFSNTSFFLWLYSLGFTESLRGFLHRLGAVILLLSMFMLILYPLFSSRGRLWWKSMLPGLRDFRQLVCQIAFYVGRRHEPPKQGVFGYVEKVEFWALVWGTVVMAITGFVLWFPKSIPETLPGWVIEVARLIHLLEAVLATLAILVWHFFHTIFHPVEYPMDTSWLTGGLSEEEAKERFDADAMEKMRPKEEPTPPPPKRPPWLITK